MCEPIGSCAGIGDEEEDDLVSLCMSQVFKTLTLVVQFGQF